MARPGRFPGSVELIPAEFLPDAGRGPSGAAIDHQTLSSDAYLKFIEDDFLGGARLNPRTDGRPDPRPGVRENAKQLGNLVSDFNFSQPPRTPFLLPTNPPTDSPSVPPFFHRAPTCVGCTALPPAYAFPGARRHRKHKHRRWISLLTRPR